MTPNEELAVKLQRLACAENEREFFDCLSNNIRTILDALSAPAQRSDARGDAIEECVRAALSKRFGPPSSWGGSNPAGWHLPRECTPTDASMHDNGCIDAAKAIRALTPKEETAGREAVLGTPQEEAIRLLKALKKRDPANYNICDEIDRVLAALTHSTPEITRADVGGAD